MYSKIMPNFCWKFSYFPWTWIFPVAELFLKANPVTFYLYRCGCSGPFAFELLSLCVSQTMWTSPFQPGFGKSISIASREEEVFFVQVSCWTDTSLSFWPMLNATDTGNEYAVDYFHKRPLNSECLMYRSPNKVCDISCSVGWTTPTLQFGTKVAPHNKTSLTLRTIVIRVYITKQNGNRLHTCV